MKTTPLLATLSLLAATPFTMASNELDTLRARCSTQEEQIRQLEAEIQRLRGETAPAPVSPPASQQTTQTTYTVRPGDSLQRIAKNLGCSPKTLAATNGLKLSSVIHPGQKLKVPDSSPTAPQATNASAGTTAATASGRSHKIQDGETFFSISRKYGISVEALTAANPNLNPRALRPGQTALLPSSTSETKQVPETATPPPSAAANTAAAGNPPQTETSTPNPKTKIQSIIVENEITYGDFAAAHGTDTTRLNDLNGLDLTNATVLAKGSELYVPAQP